MKRLLSLLLILMLGMFFYQVSAQQDDGNMMPGNGAVTTDPIVTTAPVSNLMPNSATLNATITNPDNVNITEMGFEWRKVMGGYNTTVTGTGNGNMFSATLNNLTPNTSYLYKAYIFFNGTTIYGEEVYFTTPEEGSQCPAGCGSETDQQKQRVVISSDPGYNEDVLRKDHEGRDVPESKKDPSGSGQ